MMLYQAPETKLAVVCNCGYAIDSFHPKEFCKDGLYHRGHSAICPNCGICYYFKNIGLLRRIRRTYRYSDAPYRWRSYGGYKTWLCFCNRTMSVALIISKKGWEAYCPHCEAGVLISDLHDVWEAPYIKLE